MAVHFDGWAVCAGEGSTIELQHGVVALGGLYWGLAFTTFSVAAFDTLSCAIRILLLFVFFFVFTPLEADGTSITQNVVALFFNSYAANADIGHHGAIGYELDVLDITLATPWRQADAIDVGVSLVVGIFKGVVVGDFCIFVTS